MTTENQVSAYSDALLLLLRQAKHIVVFTGAGVSAESGIPTFRDKLSGLWENYDAEMLATRVAFRRNPALVWGWYEWRRILIMQAEPNPAHLAIAKMDSLVPKLTVITQNIDDLHERSGNSEVIHLHGSIFTARCFACERPHTLPHLVSATEPEASQDIEPPRCAFCHGRIRPGVIWFGENVRTEEFAKAKRAVQSCDVLMSVGASLEVFPAAALPLEAAKRKKTVVQVNPETTCLDAVASYTLKGLAGDIMGSLLESTWPHAITINNKFGR